MTAPVDRIDRLKALVHFKEVSVTSNTKAGIENYKDMINQDNRSSLKNNKFSIT